MYREETTTTTRQPRPITQSKQTHQRSPNAAAAQTEKPACSQSKSDPPCPDREALSALYDEAVEEINSTREY
jgi:hypothetical protein